MDFIDALVKAKKALKLSESQIARDAGVSRAWINVLVHRDRKAAQKTKLAITYALLERIDNEIVRHAEEVSQLERIRFDLKVASKED